jgi:hypothetical protein
MAGVVPFQQKGGVTFQASVAVVGGMIVESDGAVPAMIRPCSAGSLKVIGIAVTDAIPVGTVQDPTVLDAPSSTNLSPIPPYVSVESIGVWPVVFAAVAVFGQRLKAAAAGQVTPLIDGTDTDPSLCIGTCYTPAGVTVIGAVGAVLLDI